jgi:hypothetical protein
MRQNSFVGGNIVLQLEHFTDSFSRRYVLPIMYSLHT